MSKDESFIFTGSSDSTITVWKDVTEQVKIDKQKVQDEKMDKYFLILINLIFVGNKTSQSF